MTNEYEDIINLPHPTSTGHRRMAQANRAAQFSPFAALTGYEAAIEETARLTDTKIDLSEDARGRLDETLALLSDREAERPEINVTYFAPDARKDGGAYITATGRLKRMDGYRRCLILMDGAEIPIDDVYEITGDIFS